uniref:PDZ domain-containing protein n=2 Tax=Hucho hucho TaxID=62062 RepID=A0A4W5RS08_9TELE
MDTAGGAKWTNGSAVLRGEVGTPPTPPRAPSAGLNPRQGGRGGTGTDREGETSEQIFSRTVAEWSPWKHTTCTSSGHEIATLTIFKMKQSLGVTISGGMENEMIFPRRAASTSDDLKTRYELVSVDGESLQRVTHQHAVFRNKAKDPVVFVKILKPAPAKPVCAPPYGTPNHNHM